MAWLWWLLAPVISTVLGALILAARGRREDRRPGCPSDAMDQHRRLMAALQQTAPASELPATMIVLDADQDSLRPAG